MILLSVARAASLFDGCPSPSGLPEALQLVGQGYADFPDEVAAIADLVDPYMVDASCRAAYDPGEETTTSYLCVGTEGVSSQSYEVSMYFNAGSRYYDWYDSAWSGDGPPSDDRAWTHLENVTHSEGVFDNNTSSSSWTRDIAWLGVAFPELPANASLHQSGGSYSSMADVWSEDRGMVLGDCSYSESTESVLIFSGSYVQTELWLRGTGWSAGTLSMDPAACADGRLVWQGTWNDVLVGAVDELGEPDPADVDRDGWPSDCGDCDDADPSVHPDATEIPADGIDQDCSGADAFAPPTPAPSAGGSAGSTPSDLAAAAGPRKDPTDAPGVAPSPRGCGGPGWSALLVGLVLPWRRRT